jgi:hypothetical protein
MYGSLIVGPLLIAPAVLILSASEQADWRRAVDALKAVQFLEMLSRSVRVRSKNELPSRDGQKASVNLVVNAYGLAGTRPQGVCFVASVGLSVTVDDLELLHDELSISNNGGSVDAPPPQCASLERMGEHDGRLVVDTVAEYAELFSIMTIDRLRLLIREPQ